MSRAIQWSSLRSFVGILCACCGLQTVHAQDVVLAPTKVSVKLTATSVGRQILPGNPTTVWQYVTEPSQTGVNKPQFPVIFAQTGQTLDITFKNDLPEATSVHWHGLDVPASMDGHPADFIPSGKSFRYRFPVLNRAGTYWFHPHPDLKTASQVAMGLAGAIIVSDPEEQALTLPRGKRDQLLVVQDRYFDANNQFAYVNSPIPGFFGNRIFVNGAVDPAMNIDNAVYRLRVINGSNARIYKLAWSNGMPMVAIGTDQGLLSAPVTRNYIMLSPGERVELWADFRSLSLNSTIKLVSQTFIPGGPSGGGNGLPQGTAMDLMTFTVNNVVTDPIVLPSNLSTTVPNYLLANVTNAANPRVIPVSITSGKFKMNGVTFSMTGVLPNEYPKLGEEQVWEFQNDTAATLMPHPIHLHSSGFKIVQRTQLSSQATAVNTMKDGLLDEGFKDTALLMPGEKMKIIMKPLFYTGRFLYHCHNLEHEDVGMMRNFIVVP